MDEFDSQNSGNEIIVFRPGKIVPVIPFIPLIRRSRRYWCCAKRQI
jgi:hypothetical protein